MTVKTELQAADLNSDGKATVVQETRPEAKEAGRGGRSEPDNKPESDAVDRARDSLESSLAGLQLTAEEERVMAEELKQLRDLGKKLDENTIEIAAFGMVSRGKSSVLNALLGREVFEVGATHGTTVNRSAKRWEQDDGQRSGPVPARLVLVNTPGIDEVGVAVPVRLLPARSPGRLT